MYATIQPYAQQGWFVRLHFEGPKLYEEGRSLKKICRPYVKIAVFDIKPIYNYQILISGVQLHKLHWGGGEQISDWGAVPTLEPPLMHINT